MRDWLRRWQHRLQGPTKSALGFYILGAMATVLCNHVRPRDYGEGNLGVRDLAAAIPSICYFDMATWEPMPVPVRLNLDNIWNMLEKELKHSFYAHSRLYNPKPFSDPTPPLETF